MDHHSVPLTDMTIQEPSDHQLEQGAEGGQLAMSDGNQLQLHQREFSLPRADGGKDAWLFLAGCCTVEALVWGGCSMALFRVPILALRADSCIV